MIHTPLTVPDSSSRHERAAQSPGQPRVPRAVYRLQFNREFTFLSAARLAPYLKDLGVDFVYCSPYFQAARGSMHGYNTTNPNSLNPEIGSTEEFEYFCRELDRHGIRQIIDIVPNHMGISGGQNEWWNDVLENGPASAYAHFFDIDWNPVKKEIEDKVLLPILGDYYGTILENQEIALQYRGGAFSVKYYDTLLPVSPDSYPFILGCGIQELESVLGGAEAVKNPFYAEYLSVMTGFQRLPAASERNSKAKAERNREKEILKKRLAELAEKSPEIAKFIKSRIELFNGRKSVPESFDLLDSLLNLQCYRLAFWRVASEEINYRRFFDVNELAAIRMEDPDVFKLYHEFAFRLLRENKVHGLRIDHPDGLYDPEEYFKRLQDSCAQAAGISAGEDSGEKSCYIVVEKILERKESLPGNWKVHGTVGYDFLNALNGIFVKKENEKPMTSVYENFIGQSVNFGQLLLDKKNIFALIHMAGEMNSLGSRLDLISERQRQYRDFTRNNLTLAIRETIACFPVYRSYISLRDKTVSDRDRRHITIAIEKAKSRTPFLNPAVYDFLKNVLLLEWEKPLPEEDRALYRDFVLRFQQITGPVMAKSLEDTAFYIYNRLLSLNEVGVDPGHFGISPEEFHAHNAERNKNWPYSFSATSTHDSKRSEDVRCRLSVLSELPDEWRSHLEKWSFINKKHKTSVGQELQPDANMEYLIYQSLLGAWPNESLELENVPALTERFWNYFLKSMREAKVRTSWINPNAEYEAAVEKFIQGILTYGTENNFLIDFLSFQGKISAFGLWNSLSSVALKIASPGVVDIYQGCELWNYSLVDPDNRRQVDYEERIKCMGELKKNEELGRTRGQISEELLRSPKNGKLKLFVLRQGLNFRKAHPDLFLGGDYRALKIEGARKNNVVAFVRESQGKIFLAAAARFFSDLIQDPREIPIGEKIWKDTDLILPAHWPANSSFVDILTGEKIRTEISGENQIIKAGDLFRSMSVSFLTNAEER